MTKSQTLKFLKRKKSQLQNTNPPHEVIKWIRVSKQYILHLFGEDSQLYKAIEGLQILTPPQVGYNESIQVMQARMAWLLDDCIELVESGSIDDKFDKNFLYRLSDTWVTVLLGLFGSIVFYSGTWYQKTTDKNEYKIEIRGEPIRCIYSPNIIVDSLSNKDYKDSTRPNNK